MYKKGDRVFVKDKWFLDPKYWDRELQQMNMYVIEVDEETDSVVLKIDRTVSMKLSDLEKHSK